MNGLLGRVIIAGHRQLWIWLLVLLVLWVSMVPLKVAERYQAHLQPRFGPVFDWSGAWQDGIKGRLDDPSFWTIFAAIVAGGMVNGARKNIPASDYYLTVYPNRGNAVLAESWSRAFLIILVVVYFASVFMKGETFFYWICSSRMIKIFQPLFPWLFEKAQSPYITLIQIAEGSIVLFSIAVGCMVVFTGLVIARSVADTFLRAPKSSWLRGASTGVASAGIAPFSFLFVAPFVFGIWSFLVRGGDPLWSLPWPRYTLIITIAVFGFPFVFVSVKTLLITKKACQMDLGVMQVHQFLMLVAMSLIQRWKFHDPPRWLLFPSEDSNQIRRMVMQGSGFITGFFPVAFWAVAR